ncbi:uncharacterized protein LOC121718634 [Alosa sapidissima]|uniref:uncharacterized protein LOC121718634 n=1 Tax=Alosa sapidissima TaxID=34773 RepID=UPI001C0A3586|nr:uncharacterized protein LOC121718634 [Alosa sapidissima]XP_041959654.1 uncharacterized protein LOC121718634 [Alosa sapidissima]
MKALALGEMLGLLAVALVAGPAEGLVLTKCEMKVELEAMLPDMDDEDDGMKGPFKMEDILAKIICKIEFTTQFNTSQVTVMDPPKPLFPGRKPWPPRRPSVGDEGSGSAGQGEGEPVPKPENPEAPADKPERPVRRPWGRPFGRPWSPPRRGKRAVMPRFRPMVGRPWGRPQQEDSQEEPEEVEEEVEEDSSTWTLYGIFQLADRVVCESEDTPSLNICQMPCSDLIDDDISDDIDCVKELKRTHEKMKLDPEQKFMALAMRAKMMAMMFPMECRSVVAADYFAECQTD